MKFDFSSVNRMAAAYQGGAKIVLNETRKGINRVVIQIERDAKKRVPTDTHHLQRSLTHEVTVSGTSVTGRAGTNVNYAETVEKGRTPGKMPPPGALVEWMGRHGIPLAKVGVVAKQNKAGYYQVEFAVARKINKRKRPHPYLKPAFDVNRLKIRSEMDAILKRIATRLAATR
jgi:hypothetical protein